MTFFGENLQNSNPRSANSNGYVTLAHCMPIGLPSPAVNILEIPAMREQFYEAQVKNGSFFLEIASENNKRRLTFPLESLPLNISRKDYQTMLQVYCGGDSSFIEPFYDALIAREDRIGFRRNPRDVKVPSFDAHYLPVSIAGAMLAQRANLSSFNKGMDASEAAKIASICGLMHDSVEDGILTFAEVADIKSPLMDDGLIMDITRTFTRQPASKNVQNDFIYDVYHDYGENIALSNHADLAVPLKWIDITSSILRDYMLGVEMPEKYLYKQMTVFQAMGNTLRFKAGQMLQLPPITVGTDHLPARTAQK